MLRRYLPPLSAAAGALLALVCAVLLLNVTAPNPTGRRYSSLPVHLDCSVEQMVVFAHAALEADLHQRANDAADQKQCVCGSSTPPRCNLCLAANVPAFVNSGRFSRPDFVAPDYLVEFKNEFDLLYSLADGPGALRDHAAAALALGRPLYLFIRVGDTLSPEVVALVAATGGAVVRYFAPPGYVDPVDTAALVGLALGALLVTTGGALMVFWRAR